jgi:hypothetical protein
MFILCNSVAGLTGNFATVKALPPDLSVYAICRGRSCREAAPFAYGEWWGGIDLSEGGASCHTHI